MKNTNKNLFTYGIVGLAIVGFIIISGCTGGCGNLNQNCCESNNCSYSNLTCSENKCLSCGGIGELCCNNNLCDVGACSDGKCEKCGRTGELCCEGNKCSSSNLACSEGKCLSCGGISELCCMNNICGEGACSNGKCEKCGGISELCCKNNKCNEGVCSGEKCKGVVETYCDLYCDSKDCYDKCYQGKKEAYKKIKIEGVSYCDSMNKTEDKNECIYLFAMDKKDVSFCEKISENSVISKTYDASARENCMGWVASAKGDISLCERISLGETLWSIIRGYSERYTSMDGYIYTKNYESSIATATHSKTYASTLLGGRGGCILRVAATREDISLCEKSNSWYERWCIYKIAVAKQNISLCGDIGDTSVSELKDMYGYKYGFMDMGYKDICISRLAEKKQDVFLCDKTSNSIGKNWCVKEVAIAKLDGSLCEKISEKKDKDECISNVKRHSVK